MAAKLVEVFMRTIGGRVTSVELTVDEASVAVANQPWTWSLSPRSFAPWPSTDYRGELVELNTAVPGKQMSRV
jgi:hypothetical protein